MHKVLIINKRTGADSFWSDPGFVNGLIDSLQVPKNKILSFVLTVSHQYFWFVIVLFFLNFL